MASTNALERVLGAAIPENPFGCFGYFCFCSCVSCVVIVLTSLWSRRGGLIEAVTMGFPVDHVAHTAGVGSSPSPGVLAWLQAGQRKDNFRSW